MKSKAVTGWIRQQRASARVDHLVRSIGMDFLLGESYSTPWDVGSALTALIGAIDECGEASGQFMVALVIPLVPSAELLTAPFDYASPDVHEVEPPALYLLDRRFFAAQFNDFEEYRIPVAAVCPPVDHGYVQAYYSCFRDPQARSNDWEYSRALWYQHFNEE